MLGTGAEADFRIWEFELLYVLVACFFGGTKESSGFVVGFREMFKSA